MNAKKVYVPPYHKEMTDDEIKECKICAVGMDDDGVFVLGKDMNRPFFMPFDDDYYFKMKLMNRQEIVEKIGEENITEFKKFMLGQNVLLKNNEVYFFECDVTDFINKINGKPTRFDLSKK